MSPSRRSMRICTAAALSLAILAPAAGEAFARDLRPPPPPYRVQRSMPSYAGDCGPNPPPGYRWDLKDWRSGFNRDFYCYVLDEY